MKALIGLGNPGHTYDGTRHNIGFMVIAQLARHRLVSLDKTLTHPQTQRPAAVYGDYALNGREVRLVMPLTMMNESGDALEALGFPADNVLVICDDVNLALGSLRMRPEGGAGGHNGLASCLAALKTETVARLRIGVAGGPLPKELHDYVLSSFPSTDRVLVKQVIAQAVEACEAWVNEGIEAAMNRHNRTQQDT